MARATHRERYVPALFFAAENSLAHYNLMLFCSSSSALNSKRSNNTFSSTDKLVYQRDTEIAESGPEDTYQLDYVYKSDDNQFAPSSERKVDGNPFHENIRSRIEDEIHSQRVNLGNVSVRVSLDERRRSGQATEDAREVKSVVMA